MIRIRDMSRVVLLTVILTAAAGCGTTGSTPGSNTGAEDRGTSAAPLDTLAEGEECSVTRHISLPAAGSPEARETITTYTEPGVAAANFVAEMLREYDTNADLAASLERGQQLLKEQQGGDGRQGSTVGTADGTALVAAARHQALLDLQEALSRGTVIVEEDEESVMFFLPEGYHAASLVAVEWEEGGWVVDTISHWLPDSECIE